MIILNPGPTAHHRYFPSINHILNTSRLNVTTPPNFVVLHSNSLQRSQFRYGTFAQGVRGLRQHTFVCRLSRWTPGDFAPVGRWSRVDYREALALVDQLLQRHRPRRRPGRCRRQKSGRGLGEYYTEHDTGTQCGCAPATPTPPPELVGLTDTPGRSTLRRAGQCRRGNTVSTRWMWSRNSCM